MVSFNPSIIIIICSVRGPFVGFAYVTYKSPSVCNNFRSRHYFPIFFINSHKALLGLEAIWRDNQVVGFIRRGEYGFGICKSLAYGYVKDPSGKPVTTEFIKSGKYSIESMGELFPAQVHLKAPFDPKNLRVQGVYDS